MADAALATMEYIAVFRLDFAASIRRRPIRDHFNFVELVARLDPLIAGDRSKPYSLSRAPSR